MKAHVQRVIELNLRDITRRHRAPINSDEGIYTLVGEPYCKSVWLQIRTTSAKWGGLRKWLVCRHCDRNVCKLFVPVMSTPNNEVPYVACRKCVKLTYKSQFGNLEIRHARLVQRLIDLYENRLIEYDGKPTRHGILAKKLEKRHEQLLEISNCWYLEFRLMDIRIKNFTQNYCTLQRS